MKLWQNVFLSLVVFGSGLTMAQVVTDSKLHLLSKTNPPKDSNAVKRTPDQWVQHCESKRVPDEAWRNNHQLAICLDEIVAKHTYEITGVECHKITKMMTEGGTKRESIAKCRDYYGYDLCIQNAENDIAKRRDCLINHDEGRDVNACKNEVTKNFSNEFTPDMCDKPGAFVKFKKKKQKAGESKSQTSGAKQ